MLHLTGGAFRLSQVRSSLRPRRQVSSSFGEGGGMEDKRRIRECLLWAGAIAMLFAAGLLVGYLKGVPVSPSYYRLMSFLHCVCSVAALSCLAALPLRVKQPPSS